MKFSLKVHGATEFVTGEEVVQIRLNTVGGGILQLHDHLEQLFRDGVVDPRENSNVLLDPIRIGDVLSLGVNVALQVEMDKHHNEHGLPVVRLEVKDEGHERLDVEALEGLRDGKDASHQRYHSGESHHR